MHIPAIVSNKRTVRVGLGVALCTTLALGAVPLLQSKSGLAMTFVQASGDRARFSAADILARFPKEKHEEFMRRAIVNSRKAAEPKTGGVFGAVIVAKDGTVIADGLYRGFAENDPTWHAETHAIRVACAALKKPKLDGCILYTSAEPCPMCLAAAYWAELDGIFYASTAVDAKKYGNVDNDFLYEQLSKQIQDRALSEQNFLRPEAVEVWKEYKDRKDKLER
jgi:guanine deaminase